MRSNQLGPNVNNRNIIHTSRYANHLSITASKSKQQDSILCIRGEVDKVGLVLIKVIEIETPLCQRPGTEIGLNNANGGRLANNSGFTKDN
ncbi:unnamed protein product [Fusarium graminearum]|nr:unnamed protein product [Fusarium graminearum]